MVGEMVNVIAPEQRSRQSVPTQDARKPTANWHYALLLYPAIVMMPVQDFIWRGSAAGFFGAAPSGFLFAPFIVLDAVSRLRHSSQTPFLARKLGLLVAMLIIGAFTGLAWIATQPNPTALLERFGVKSLTIAILQACVLYPALLPPKRTPMLMVAVFLSLLVAGMGFLLSDVMKLPGFTHPSMLHISPAVTSPRGFSLELSTFAATVSSTIFLLACLSRTPFIRVAFAVAALSTAVLVESKGGIAASLVVGTYLVLFNRRIPVSAKIVATALAPFLIGTFLEYFSARVHLESVQYTSIGTRSLYAVISVTSLPEHPIGVGFAGFVPFFLGLGPRLQGIAGLLHLSSAQLSEVWTYYVAGTGYNAGTKTLLGDMLLIWGFIGLAAVAWYLWRPTIIALSGRDPIAGACFLYSAIALLFHVPGMTLYIVPLAIGIAREALLTDSPARGWSFSLSPPRSSRCAHG